MAFFTPEQIDALSATTVRISFLVEFQFQSETIRVWDGNTELVAGGETWIPTFGSGTIDGLNFNGNSESHSVTFRLNGLPGQNADFLRVALDETQEVAQQMVIVYLQLFDDDWQTIGSPIGIFWGFMQPPSVTRTQMQGTDGGSQSITLVAENAFFNRSRPSFGRYTDRDQQKRSSGDKFFQFIPGLLFKNIVWPDY